MIFIDTLSTSIRTQRNNCWARCRILIERPRCTICGLFLLTPGYNCKDTNFSHSERYKAKTKKKFLLATQLPSFSACRLVLSAIRTSHAFLLRNRYCFSKQVSRDFQRRVIRLRECFLPHHFMSTSSKFVAFTYINNSNFLHCLCCK